MFKSLQNADIPFRIGDIVTALTWLISTRPVTYSAMMWQGKYWRIDCHAPQYVFTNLAS